MKSKIKLLAVALIAGGSMFAQSRVSIGVNIGGYGPGAYPPPAYVAYRPPCPGPDYTWVDGYWSGVGASRAWVNGFWRAPVVVAPRYVAPRYYDGHRDYYRRDADRFYRGDRDYRGDRHDDRGYRNGFRR